MKKSKNDVVVDGVCAGIAKELNIKPIVVRLIFLFLFQFSVWPYLFLMFILDEEK